MFALYISFLPEFFLLVGAGIILFVAHFRSSNTPKTYFTLAKFFVGMSLLSTVVFYNQSVEPHWFRNSSYTTLFKVLIYLAALAAFYLGCKWFLNKNRSSMGYYLAAMLSLLLLTLAVSAQNMLVLFACLELSFALNVYFIRLNLDEDITKPVLRRFLFGGALSALIFISGLLLFYKLGIPYDWHGAYAFFETHDTAAWQYSLAAVLILIPLLYMLGIAPFHLWFADVIGAVHLPVATFITFIPPVAYIAVLIEVLSNVFYPLYPELHRFIACCGALSVLVGAVGANSKTDLRRMFAYVGLCNWGIVLVCLSWLNDNGLLCAFICMLVYLLAQFGIYTTFYAFKSKGEYLSELSELSGVSEVRPYISAALLVFMVSMLGTPPMLGFLGKLSVINYLIIQGSYVFIGLILTALLLLAYAFLNVIKAVYFDSLTNVFDRADKGVYICLMINLILVLISILNPKYLMHDAEAILSTVL